MEAIAFDKWTFVLTSAWKNAYQHKTTLIMLLKHMRRKRTKSKMTAIEFESWKCVCKALFYIINNCVWRQLVIKRALILFNKFFRLSLQIEKLMNASRGYWGFFAAQPLISLIKQSNYFCNHFTRYNHTYIKCDAETQCKGNVEFDYL